MNRARRSVIGLLALALVALVDDTLTAALPNLRLSQPARVERQPCKDALGAPSQDVYLHFERNFPIDGPQADQLVADTERTWRERGYAVKRDTFRQDVSIRNATVDGYSMSLVVNRTTKQGHLGVSSPCVQPRP
jgi:hypothetical protein